LLKQSFLTGDRRRDVARVLRGTKNKPWMRALNTRVAMGTREAVKT
jgi:hypothetical protein